MLKVPTRCLLKANFISNNKQKFAAFNINQEELCRGQFLSIDTLYSRCHSVSWAHFVIQTFIIFWENSIRKSISIEEVPLPKPCPFKYSATPDDLIDFPA